MRARRAPVVQQHQREQAAHLGLGAEADQEPAEPDGFRGKIEAQRMLAAAGGIALVEHEVDHAQHALEARGQSVGLGDLIRDAGVTDLRLGADDALGERRGGRQERAGDFLGGEATDLAQGQRDACVFR